MSHAKTYINSTPLDTTNPYYEIKMRAAALAERKITEEDIQDIAKSMASSLAPEQIDEIKELVSDGG